MASTMALKLASLVSLFLCMAKSSFGIDVFDVTQYGALADGSTDNSQAFLKAWGVACNSSGPAEVLIPQGTYLTGPVTFIGPCNNGSMQVQIQGRLLAPSSLDGFTYDWIEFRELQGFEVTGGGALDGQGALAWIGTSCPTQRLCKNRPVTMKLCKVSNGTISNLRFIDSKGFHMSITQSSQITVHDLNITAPGNSPNTDGIHISSTTGVIFDSLTIGTGDDCVSIGPGTTNISISRVNCGPGHGISVGSLGKYPNEGDVIGVEVKNCTFFGTDNGVRIKTWPGAPPSTASNMVFEDIVMNNVSNPIFIDQFYCPPHHCTDEPSQVKINNVTYRGIRGTSFDPVVVNLQCSQKVPCENVHLEDIQLEPSVGVPNNMSASCTNVLGQALGTPLPSPCF